MKGGTQMLEMRGINGINETFEPQSSVPSTPLRRSTAPIQRRHPLEDISSTSALLGLSNFILSSRYPLEILNCFLSKLRDGE
ncbi:hypothetical protein Pyn_38706 [Prunus yedoensis var. nudiflora]|uniref:Uncharacterized protein n=1 Tax=Prunus yedoensis var. nudiflora TaxID=2094558 RepID=A0A314Z5H0_PRUYE|nr:hypothetical protein Pyn_38706 [Prunus yedoensis var. nudiflora]